jgi:hypothetical protein
MSKITTKLPKDVLKLVIFSYLPPIDRTNLLLTDRLFQSLVTSNKIENYCKLRSKKYFKSICEYGYINLLKKSLKDGAISRYALYNDPYNCYLDAAKNGHIIILQWIIPIITTDGDHRDHSSWSHKICCTAAEHGHQEILEWLWPMMTYDYLTKICISAIKGDRFDILQWLYSNGATWDNDAYSIAAQWGRFEILQWLWKIRRPDIPTRTTSLHISSSAAAGGHLDILEWLVANGVEVGNTAAIDAADAGHVHILKWLYLRNIVLDEDGLELAAANGHLAVLEWAYSIGIPMSIDIGEAAIHSKDITLIKWLLDHGLQRDHRLCAKASTVGNLSILIYLIDQKCPVDHTAYECAVRFGQLGVMKYLHSIKVPIFLHIVERLAYDACFVNITAWLKETYPDE